MASGLNRGLSRGLNLVICGAGVALAWLVGRWATLLPLDPWLATIAASAVLLLVPLVALVAGFGRRLWLWRCFAGLLWIVPLLLWAQQDSQQLRQLVSSTNPWPRALWKGQEADATHIATKTENTPKPITLTPPPGGVAEATDAGANEQTTEPMEPMEPMEPTAHPPKDATPGQSQNPTPAEPLNAAPDEDASVADAPGNPSSASVAAQELTSSPWSDDVVEIFEDDDGLLTLRIVGTPERPEPAATFDYQALETQAEGNWPLPAIAHPVAVEARARHGNTSYVKAAKFIRRRLMEQAERARALHDFVALHVAYDVEAWKTRQLGPQDAESVFKSRKAVCAGYARLLHAMAEQADLRSHLVIGKARYWNRRPQAEGHAWNAIFARGSWWLFDPTWDSGFVQGERFVRRYDSSFAFIPPELMLQTHEPKDPRWRLLPASHPNPPADRPFVHPRLAALGLSLRAPRRALSVAIQPKMMVAVDNPKQALIQVYVRGQTAASQRCTEEAQPGIFRCPLPDFGRYEISVMAAAAGASTLELAARFAVQRTPR